jgi:RNA polymerase sigma-70 factor (ECF subfamily)
MKAFQKGVKKNAMNNQFVEIYERNVDSVYRICFMYCKNKSDTEDMTQNTFLKLAEHFAKSGQHTFNNHEHETAWLIRVAVNLCKNSLKSLWNRRVAWNDWECESQTAYGYGGAYGTIPEPDETLMKLMKLPSKLKTALYLHYYEDYSTAQIAKMMGKPESTVRGYLHRGRKALKKAIESEEAHESLNESDSQEMEVSIL